MSKKVIVFMIGTSAVLLVAISFLFYKIVINPAKHVQYIPPVSSPRPAGEPAMVENTRKTDRGGDEGSSMKTAEDLVAKNPDSPQAESAYFLLAAAYEKKGDLLKARDAYQKIIEKFPGSNNITRAQESMENLNVKILFAPEITQGFLIYEVQKGDSLSRIARNHGTTVEFIMKANNLKDNTIRIGKKVKLPKTRFDIIVDKSQNILTLKAGSEIVKTYSVATGKDSCTPVGTFKITNKIVDPPWYPPKGGVVPARDPKNVLGSRWIGLSKPTYGIHGTIEPESIGRSVTEGCVRMHNSDVEELYAIVPEGTEVVIVD